MSIKELIACNKDPKTKKVFKDAEGLIRRLTRGWLNDPKIKVTIDLWKDEVLGKKDYADPDAYLYCYINDKSRSDEKVDNMIDKKGESWHDWLAEVFQDPENKEKLPRELQKYIDGEDDGTNNYSGSGYAIIINGKRGRA